MIEVTYVCGFTGTTVVSSEGLPKGWVVPSSDMSQDIDKPVPERYTVIAFSSEKAYKEMAKARLQEGMMNLKDV